METQGTKPVSSQLYVYAPEDWPLWQAAERRDATARYAARTPVAASQTQRTLPQWPFAVLFALAMLALVVARTALKKPLGSGLTFGHKLNHALSRRVSCRTSSTAVCGTPKIAATTARSRRAVSECQT